MIKGVHTMFYTSGAESLRHFIKDKFGFKATDVGDCWLMFDIPESEMGCRPSDESGQNEQPDGTHDISFYCDNIKETVAELKLKGVEFVQKIEDHGYGLVSYFKMPGKLVVQPYLPYYKK